jgi:flagellar basal-body rod protein FlgG
MLEGMYTAAAGMAAQQQRLDALSNDVSNANTNGYKHIRLAFRDLLYTPQGYGAGPQVRVGSGAAAVQIGRGSEQGALRQTGRSLDVGLQGPGYIQVRTASGRVALTRDGSLDIDAGGRMTANGALLDPPVTVPAGVDRSQLQIGGDGTITAAGRRIGALTLRTVRAPEGLQPNGDNTFTPTAASGAPAPAGVSTTVNTGTLEASDVDMADVMVDMIDAQRGYSFASRVIQMQDEMAGIANGVKR